MSVRPASNHSDFATLFDFNAPSHTDAFINLSLQRGEQHGWSMNVDRADVLPSFIGRDFEITFLCAAAGQGMNTFKAMATTAEVNFIGGKLLFLENLTVDKKFRGQGCDFQLWSRELLRAWESEFDGFAWEIRREDKDAVVLSERIDPSFQASSSPAIWRISTNNIIELTREETSCAKLATISDLETIVAASKKQTVKNYDYLSRSLLGQAVSHATAKSLIVVAPAGGFAVASDVHSPVENRRVDVRTYLAPSYNEGHVNALVRGVALQVLQHRRWVTCDSIHIELNDNSKLGSAKRALKAVGCELLQYNSSQVISNTLSGREYIAAIIEAARSPTGENRLSVDASHRLHEAAQRYGLGFGQTA